MAKLKPGSMRFPARVRDLDFSKLYTSQVWLLADFIGARRLINAAKAPDRAAVLKQYCMDNEERAQKGYEICILQKEQTEPGTVVSADVEKRMYEVLTDIVVKHEDAIDQKAETAVTKQAEKVKSGLEMAAKEVVRAAAESRAP